MMLKALQMQASSAPGARTGSRDQTCTSGSVFCSRCLPCLRVRHRHLRMYG